MVVGNKKELIIQHINKYSPEENKDGPFLPIHNYFPLTIISSPLFNNILQTLRRMPVKFSFRLTVSKNYYIWLFSGFQPDIVLSILVFLKINFNNQKFVSPFNVYPRLVTD